MLVEFLRTASSPPTGGQESDDKPADSRQKLASRNPRARRRGNMRGAGRARIRWLWRVLGRDRCAAPTAVTGHHRQVVTAGAAVPGLIHRRPQANNGSCSLAYGVSPPAGGQPRIETRRTVMTRAFSPGRMRDTTDSPAARQRLPLSGSG
jgi:hypothetical protein